MVRRLVCLGGNRRAMPGGLGAGRSTMNCRGLGGLPHCTSCTMPNASQSCDQGTICCGIGRTQPGASWLPTSCGRASSPPKPLAPQDRRHGAAARGSLTRRNPATPARRGRENTPQPTYDHRCPCMQKM
ncbi:hypothetical protein K456DRAFT_1515959 [Colletotrichum gloeosporioides 23]|nr:hypothetical protein K456DRAFT_1515959 [Colletotrichum gloeosporioides 23]